MTIRMDESLPLGLDRDGSPPLTVLESRAGPRVVLTVKGEVDLASCDGLRAALEGVADSGVSEIWLDLTHVGFMDSTGLNVLVEAHRELNGRSFALICPEGPVRRVIAVSGIDKVIPVHVNRSAADGAT